MTCLSCHASTSNGLALCDLCQRKVTLDLQFLPIYFRNLARWKPGRAGSRPVPGSRVLYDGDTAPAGDRVERALDEAAAAVDAWAARLAGDRPGHLPRVVARISTFDHGRRLRLMCMLLERRLTSVATTEWAGEFAESIGAHEAMLRVITEQVAPGWYAGGCRRCGTPTHVVPGLTWVTCGGCGATTYARDHLDTVLDEARGWVGRPMRLAEAIVALVDTEMSVPRLHKRISKWGEREQIEAVRRVDRDGDEVGPKRFRLGDVLDRLFTEGATRLDSARGIARTSG